VVLNSPKHHNSRPKQQSVADVLPWRGVRLQIAAGQAECPLSEMYSKSYCLLVLALCGGHHQFPRLYSVHQSNGHRMAQVLGLVPRVWNTGGCDYRVLQSNGCQCLSVCRNNSPVCQPLVQRHQGQSRRKRIAIVDRLHLIRADQQPENNFLSSLILHYSG
jgi:hypothetical protein